MPLAKVTVTGTILALDGETPLRDAYVVISASAPILKDMTDNVILASTTTVKTNRSGYFEVDLPATNDPNVAPADFTYSLTVVANGYRVKRATFLLPLGVSPVDIVDIIPVELVPTTSTILEEALAARDAAIQAAIDAEAAMSGKADIAHTHDDRYYTEAEVDAIIAGLPGGGSPSDHGGLTGLLDDDHPQYLTEARGDARYYTQDEVDTIVAGLGGGGGGVSDHGALTGLADDDHTQYHNDTRGDARYYTKAQVDLAVGGKADTAHTHTKADVTDFAHTHDASEISNLPEGTVLSVNGETGIVVIDKADVGLGSVDNTSDAAKPISTATQTALDGKVPLPGALRVVVPVKQVAGAYSMTGINRTYHIPHFIGPLNPYDTVGLPGEPWDKTEVEIP